MKLLLMADGKVGLEIASWLMREHPDDLSLIVTAAKNEIFDVAQGRGFPAIEFASSAQLYEVLKERGIQPDLGLLAWWPFILKPPLLGATAHGFINTHPSLLPHNRGKHYNFWALVEQAPFGVSLHFVNEGIDSGDVIAQTPIHYGWEDTGGTLYAKAAREMFALFSKAYPSICRRDMKRVPQNPNAGSFHMAKELEIASQIDLDKSYRARDLLNLLRARTFPGHPACTFTDDDVEYEVRIEIKKKTA